MTDGHDDALSRTQSDTRPPCARIPADEMNDEVQRGAKENGHDDAT
jgi:hypothetical protein